MKNKLQETPYSTTFWVETVFDKHIRVLFSGKVKLV